MSEHLRIHLKTHSREMAKNVKLVVDREREAMSDVHSAQLCLIHHRQLINRRLNSNAKLNQIILFE